MHKTLTVQKFTLKILWLDHSIGFAIDHVAEQGFSPLTSYFFWPRNDAWTQLEKELESKPWISISDKIDILNKVTCILNYWQENKKKDSFQKAKKKFPTINFYAMQ